MSRIISVGPQTCSHPLVPLQSTPFGASSEPIHMRTNKRRNIDSGKEMRKMITSQLKHLAERFNGAREHWRRSEKERRFRLRSLRGYLAVAAILVLAFSLAAGVWRTPH